jgi:hypothetical protein
MQYLGAPSLKAEGHWLHARAAAISRRTQEQCALPPAAFSAASLAFLWYLQFRLPSSHTKRLTISPDFHIASQPAPVASRCGLSLVSPTRADGNHRHLCFWEGSGVDGRGGFSTARRSPKAGTHTPVLHRHPSMQQSPDGIRPGIGILPNTATIYRTRLVDAIKCVTFRP